MMLISMRSDAAILDDLSLSIQLGYSVCLSGGMIWSKRCHGALGTLGPMVIHVTPKLVSRRLW